MSLKLNVENKRLYKKLGADRISATARFRDYRFRNRTAPVLLKASADERIPLTFRIERFVSFMEDPFLAIS